MITGTKKPHWPIISLLIVAVGVGVIAAIWGQPLIHDKPDAIQLLVTIFSILAGFLVAIIALLGDPFLPSGTWRAKEYSRPKIRHRLTRHKYLFYCYLLVLALIFCSILLHDDQSEWVEWLERAYLFFAAFAYVMSLSLPLSLSRLQEERLEKLIEESRREAGITARKTESRSDR